MAYEYMLVFVLVAIQLTIAHIPPPYESPMRFWEWAEPSNVIVIEHSPNKEQSLKRLQAFRAVLEEYKVDAYIIPTQDAHGSQYIAPIDARREWLSGFTGSNGVAVVTPSKALLWTDARYFVQFDMEVDTTNWILMRQGTDLTIRDWLLSAMSPGDVVGVDPTTYSRSAWLALESILATQMNVTLTSITTNLVDIARKNYGEPAPPRPNKDLLPLTFNYTGELSSTKISTLINRMRERGTSMLVLTALDDIAYTLNLRGSDIPYNPVFFSYLIIRTDVESPHNVIMFWGNGTLADDIRQHLISEGTFLQVQPYDKIFDYIADVSVSLADGSIIWLSQDASHAIHLVAETNKAVTTLATVSPVALMKCVKNSVEIDGFRSAHVKDGVAVVRFWRWLHESLDLGDNVTEVNVSDKLEELRSEEVDSMGPSFSTIAGAGENGAVIHYKPSRDGPQRVITKDDMMLVDSGGQYKHGTTDITRTRHMSASPSAEQKVTFTRVLKGQILLGTAVFPKGVTGNVLETLARKALWDVGLNYAHGTGHGVGHFLNVHEGPSGIGGALMPTDPGIVPGMIFSNEPGYYEEGYYGIRHEDLVEVIEINKTADHPMAKGIIGDFNGRGAVGFNTLTLVPHQTACLDIDILSDFEIEYINEYHTRVLDTLGPILQSRNLIEDYEWLKKECTSIQSNSAILLQSAPLLIILSIFNLYSEI